MCDLVQQDRIFDQIACILRDSLIISVMEKNCASRFFYLLCVEFVLCDVVQL